MQNSETVKSDISALDADISRYLSQTRNGVMIDIATLPERLTDIHRRVQTAGTPQRAELSTLFQQVIGSLDKLAREIQIRHDAAKTGIDQLEQANPKE